MLQKPKPKATNLPLELRCDRVILHFDYDCFYASVFEAEDPSLKLLPLAVQQKHIIVTCNYEARRRGLYKLQLIADARRICPEVIIVLGEDLTRFRDVSKDLARFLASHVWSNRCERLGFDETWLDCTSMIDYNLDLLKSDLTKAFFQLDQTDPTIGFEYDASKTPGHVFPEVDALPASTFSSSAGNVDPLELRLRLGAHLAQYLRAKLEDRHFTATVGISVNKLLSKLVGNLHKPDAQTTLMPPYNFEYGSDSSSVSKFLDNHEIGKIPGIGFKISNKLREVLLGRESNYHNGFGPVNSNDGILVGDIRTHPDLTVEYLQKILGGPGWPKDVGKKVYELVNGVDDTEVAAVKLIPTQISIEDSYLVLDNFTSLRQELLKLSTSLVKRMRTDLIEDPLPSPDAADQSLPWLAHPRTLRLTTRPRPPRKDDGTRQRAFQRISRSGPFPSFLLANLPIDQLTPRFVDEVLLKMFRRLHPEPEWDLSLVNIGITNLEAMAGEGKGKEGKDLRKMFIPTNTAVAKPSLQTWGSEDEIVDVQQEKNEWDEKEEGEDEQEYCRTCGASMPGFAMEAHLRFHLLPD